MGENREKKFISERILGREMTWRRAVRWILVSLACGLVFGAAAFGVYYIARTAVEKEEEVTETVPETTEEIPEETELQTEETTEEVTTEAVTTEAETETGSESSTEETGEGETGEAESETTVLDLVKEAQDSYEFGAEDLGRILGAQQKACENISTCITKVRLIISEVTWFESTVETTREYSGIILSTEEDEILILTVAGAVSENGTLSVTFSDGSSKVALVKQKSEKDGWAVLAVSKEGMGSEFLENVKAVEICPAEEIVCGMPVISAGNPMGVSSSYGFGYVNYVGKTESIEDGSRKLCYSEAASVPLRGTFLMSMDGRLVGLGEEKEKEQVSGNRFLIADSCQAMLDSLRKGYDQAWLGITGTDISFEMKYRNIPEGLYVTSVNESSPAFEAGLKRGDIIVNIGSREIRGLSDYLSFLRNLRPDETVSVTVKREAVRQEYKELEMTMTAGVR